MSTLYLIRHGQAGSRDNYDMLSELGQQQAQLLGQHWATQQTIFHRVYAGGLKRQQETAQIVMGCLNQAERNVPPLITDERWNEFSLATVYRGLAPRLIYDDATFADDFEAMKTELLTDPHATRGAAGRCDRAVIEAWMGDCYPDYDGESWASFRARVQKGLNDFTDPVRDETVAIFSSATPIAISVGTALALPNEKILRLMAVLYNSSVTVLRFRLGELLLMSFNATPHITDPRQQTFR